MNKLLVIIVCCVSLFSACTEEKPGFYKGKDGVCFYWAGSMYDSTPYPDSYAEGLLSSGKLRDTLYFKLWVMGNISTHDRRLVLKQSVLSSTDSSSYANKNVAVAGGNYVAFDDPEMEKFLIIPPDSSYVYIPVIMTYDPTIAGTRQDFRLHFEIVPTDELPIMDSRFYRATVTFSQREY